MTIQDVLKAQMTAPASGVVDPNSAVNRNRIAGFADALKAKAMQRAAGVPGASIRDALEQTYSGMKGDALGRYNVGVGLKAAPANYQWSAGAIGDATKDVFAQRQDQVAEARAAAASAEARDRMAMEMLRGRSAMGDHDWRMEQMAFNRERSDMERRIQEEKMRDQVLQSIFGGIGTTLGRYYTGGRY